MKANNRFYSSVKTLNSSTTDEDLIKLYALWGSTYDKVNADNSYTGPAVAASMLHEKLKEFGFDRDVNIADLGCGTGLVGEQLHKMGYKNIDGVDLSEEMLERAKDKGVYRLLRKGSMGSDNSVNLALQPGQYDAVICVGVFASGHVKEKGMDDFLFVVKAGGLIVFTINESVMDDSAYKYYEKMEVLSKQAKWNLVLKCYEPKYICDRGAYVFVYQKL